MKSNNWTNAQVGEALLHLLKGGKIRKKTLYGGLGSRTSYRLGSGDNPPTISEGAIKKLIAKQIITWDAVGTAATLNPEVIQRLAQESVPV